VNESCKDIVTILPPEKSRKGEAALLAYQERPPGSAGEAVGV